MTPGPGEYHSEKQRFKGHFMGTSNRALNVHPEKTPGPGAYKLPYYIADLPEYAHKDKQAEHKYRWLFFQRFYQIITSKDS